VPLPSQIWNPRPPNPFLFKTNYNPKDQFVARYSQLSLTLFQGFLPIFCVHFSNFSFILLAPPIQLFFDYSINFSDREKSFCPPLCSLFQPSLTSSTLRPNIPLRTLCSNTLTYLQRILRFFYQKKSSRHTYKKRFIKICRTLLVK